MNRSRTPRYFCRNKGCFYNTTDFYNFRRHRCKKKGKSSSGPGFTAPSSAVPQRASTSLPVLTEENMQVPSPPFIEDNPCPEETGDTSEQSIPDSSIIRDFCNIVTNSKGKKSFETVKQIIRLLHDDRFDLQLFRSSIPNIEACFQLQEHTVEHTIRGDGFKKGLATFYFEGESHNGYYFYRDPVAVLQEQVVAASNTSNFNFSPSNVSSTVDRSGPSNTNSVRLTHPLQTSYFKDLHDIRMFDIMKSPHPDVRWCSNSQNKSFIGFLQMFTDKTVMTMKVTGIAAHAVHLTFINLEKKTRRTFIQNGLTIIGFLPCSKIQPSQGTHCPCIEDDGTETLEQEVNESTLNIDNLQLEEVDMEDTLVQTSSTDGRTVKIGLLQVALIHILKPVLDVVATGFSVGQLAGIHWNCFPTLCSYCCDIPEAKDFSGVKSTLFTPRPCHRCYVNMDDIINIKKRHPRSYKHTKALRTEAWEYETTQHRQDYESQGQQVDITKSERLVPKSVSAKEFLQTWSLSPSQGFIETILENYPGFIAGGIYDLFSFEPLHNLHLGLSRLLKIMLFEFITSLGSKRTSILRACNAILRQIEIDSHISQLHVDFSKKESSTQLNGIFLATGIRGMLEGKDFKNLDYVFPFIAAYVDRFRDKPNDPSLTVINAMYSDLLFKLFHTVQLYGMSQSDLKEIESHVCELKKKAKEVFSPIVQRGLYTLKFHLLDHLVTDLERYTSLDFLDASPYEYYNTHIKKAYRLGSKRKSTALQETVDNLEQTDAVFISKITMQKKGTYSNTQCLASEGFKSTLRELTSLPPHTSTKSISKLSKEIYSCMNHSDIHVLPKLIHEELKTHNIYVPDDNVILEIVKSGTIETFHTPTLESYSSERNKVLYNAPMRSQTFMKRVFATASFGPAEKKRHSFVFMKGSDDGSSEEFWFAQTLLLFYLKCDHMSFEQQYAFVRYMRCTPPLDAIDRNLNCVCLRWETTEDTPEDCTSQYTDIDSTTQPRDANKIITGESYGLVSFKSLCGVVHLVRANYAVKPFTKELPWTQHRFYVNRFYP